MNSGSGEDRSAPIRVVRGRRFVTAILVSALVIALAPVPALRAATILFDETRLKTRKVGEGIAEELSIEDEGTYGASDLVTQLEDLGHTVSALRTRPITQGDLEGIDVLVILQSSHSDSYLPSEASAIRDFVVEGGGLLVAGSAWRGSDPSWSGASAVARAFGIEFGANGRVHDSESNYNDMLSVSEVTGLEDCPLSDGISSLFHQGTYISDPGGATVLAETSASSWFDQYTADSWGDDEAQPAEPVGPLPIMAWMGFGEGRVVVCAGAYGFWANDWIDKADHETLAANLFQWLAEKGAVAGSKQPVACLDWRVLPPADGSRLIVEARETESIEVDGCCSFAPEGEILSYMWDWDSDGTFDASSDTSLAQVTLPYTENRTITLRVTDGSGNTDQCALTRDAAADRWYAQGRDLAELAGDAAAGEIAFSNAVALVPTHRAVYALPNVLGVLGRHEEAIEVCDYIVASTDAVSIEAWALCERSHHLRLLCRFEEAKEAATSAIELDPDSSHGHVTLGRAFLRAGAPRDALEAFEVAKELGADVANDRAQVLFFLGRYADAKSSWENADDSGSLIALPWLAAMQGNFDLSIELGEAALPIVEGTSQEPIVKNNLAFAHFHRGDTEDALRYLEDVFAIGTESLNPYTVMESSITRGRIQLVQGKLAEARESFLLALAFYDVCIDCHPDARDLEAHVGFSLWALGDSDAAASHLDSAMMLSRGDMKEDTIGREAAAWLASRPPTASLSVASETFAVGRSVAFDGSGSADVDGPIAAYEWSVDGVPVEGENGDSLTWVFRDVGEHSVTLIVADTDGATSMVTQEFDVIVTPGIVEPARVWALVIGISDYFEVNDLRYAEADAVAFTRWLLDAGVDPEHIKLLLDDEEAREDLGALAAQQATLARVRAGLDWLRRMARSDDLVFVFFAGHGYQGEDDNGDEADGVDEFLVVYDTLRDCLEASSLRDDEFGYFLDRVESEHVMVVFDSCYSGGQSRSLSSGTRPLPGSFDIFQDFSLDGKLILAAASEDQKALEDETLGHGVFTHYLLRGLEGEADLDTDYRVTAEELYAYVGAEVEQFAKEEMGARQTPQLTGRGTVGIVVARTNEPPTAAFTVEPDVPYAHGRTQFNDASSDDSEIVSWHWSLGDSSISTDQHPTHTYEEAVTYTVTLTVTDDEGASSTLEQQIAVTPGGQVTTAAGDTIIISLGSANGVHVGDRFEVIRVLRLSSGTVIHECKAVLKVVEILDVDRSACRVVEMTDQIEPHDRLRPLDETSG